MRDIPNDYVYLDYAATSPLCKESYEAMKPYLEYGPASVKYGTNPNSLSTPGRIAFKALEDARRIFACSIGTHRPSEVVFTSSATEADNAAIAGIVAAEAEQRRKGNKEFVPEIITSEIEHDAVLAEVARLEREGVRVVRLRPDRDGFVEVSSLQNALTSNTVLVTIQMANSEIGSIQPIKQLAEASHSIGARFHTDATQALGKIPINVEELGVDAASFSGHKIGAPKGIGALYLRNRTPFAPEMLGGGQEEGRRSGTQNVCGAAAFAAAASCAAASMEDESARQMYLRDKLYSDLASFPRIQPTCEVEQGSLDYLPNIVNVMVQGIESETLVLRFDSLGFAVSGGSACASHSLDPSHVLTSLGISADEALSELRVSIGRWTTREDIDRFLKAVPEVLDWN